MTNNVTINNKNRTIEITKKFATAAKRYGTSEYEDLQSVRKDYPQYHIVMKPSAKKTDSFKGMTFSFMENYILNNDDEEVKKDFYHLCGKNEDGSELDFAPAATYGEIKKWFLNKHQEFKERRNKIDKILNKNAA